jgi:2-amino-4-hydroxy-6-hydroxymethyldihydropteridine diphosphokinase
VPTVYLGLGSNIEPKKNLGLALRELETRFGQLERSSVYRSKAYGFDGDDFLNMVVGLVTSLPPSEIHDQAEEIQRMAGRDESARGYSSRALDIDLLLYDDLIVDEPRAADPLAAAGCIALQFRAGPIGRDCAETFTSRDTSKLPGPLG